MSAGESSRKVVHTALKDVRELSLGDTVPVEYDALGRGQSLLLNGLLVTHIGSQDVLGIDSMSVLGHINSITYRNHLFKILNNLDARLLHLHGRDILSGVTVNIPDHRAE